MGIDYKLLGKRIKEQRKKENKTQEQVAEAISVTVGYISQIERGITRPNLDTLSELARCLRCGLGDLLGGTSKGETAYLDRELQAVYRQMSDRQKKMLLGIAEVLKNGE